MQNKPFTIILGVLVALILLAGTCSAGFVAGRVAGGSSADQRADIPFLPQLNITPALGDNNGPASTPRDLQSLFRPFWQAWDLINELYVDQPVDQTVLMRGAIKGMIDALGDQHSSYLDPKMFDDANAHLQGEEYEGIGAWVDVTGDYLRIISPMPKSPAEPAGLRAGDLGIAVDGEDMTGKDGEYARQHVLGPRDSVVTLTIRREGVDEPFDVKVTRRAITVPSVTGSMLEDKIAYIQLFTFGDDTADDLKQTLKGLLDQKPVGLILDLRNNGGGYRDTAIDVASEFIPNGTIMIEEYGDGKREVLDAKRGGLAIDIPMVVLVNEGSASASEIVAGAVQDRQRGYLVGVQSYGKGSVQNIIQLDDNQGAVRVTVARWLTPLERHIHGVGLRPEFWVEITEDDVKNNRDSQLNKAIEVLLQHLTPPPTPVPSPPPTLTPVP